MMRDPWSHALRRWQTDHRLSQDRRNQHEFLSKTVSDVDKNPKELPLPIDLDTSSCYVLAPISPLHGRLDSG